MVANLMVTAQPQANPPGWVDVIDHQHIANGPHRSTIRGRVSRVGPARRRTLRPIDGQAACGRECAARTPSVMVGRNALSGIRFGGSASARTS